MDKKTAGRPRSLSLDLIRFLATLFVVLNHCTEETYPVYSSGFYQLSSGSRIFGITCFSLGRIGVPLFLLLTGYLLLPREYDEDRTKRFYRHNLLSLLAVWEIWILIYQVYLCLYNQIPFPKKEYLLKVLLLKNAGLPHTWYMPIIIGIYIFLPLVSAAVRHVDDQTLLRLLGITFVFLFVVNSSVSFCKAFHIKELYIPSRKLDLNFSGGTYGFYVVLGYCAARFKTGITSYVNSHQGIVSATAVVALALTVYAQVFLRSVSYSFNVWYDFATLPVCSFCIFCLLYNKKIPENCSSMLTLLSSCSFGVFLIHEMILKTMISSIAFSSLQFSVIARWFIISLLSFLIVHLLSQIPGVNHLFLHK